LHGVVFRVAATEYTWQDVLDWGHRQGEWSDHVREVREGVAALALARESGEPPEDDVRVAAAAFRRRHRLISAEDTERWLAERRISVAAWMDHVRRSLARDRQRERVSGLGPDAEGSAVEELQLWTAGVCSGLYPNFAIALAERVAAAEAWAETGPGAGPAGDRWDALEAASIAFRAAAATDRAVAEEVLARRLDWIDLDLEWVSFPEEATAREALLCLREDGDFSAALFSGDTPASGRRRARLCDFEAELRPTLIGARTGDAIGPARMAGGWRVTRVLSRRVPAEGDEEVRRRAVAAVQARAVRREVERRVRWHVRY